MPPLEHYFRFHFPGANILVVDDFEMNLEATKVLLERMRCNVDLATSGAEAVELFHSKAYDLILMDIQMPDMNGYEVTQKIRKSGKKGRKIPIVAVTANTMDEAYRECLKHGMTDYIGKPEIIKQLCTVLSKYLQDNVKVAYPPVANEA